MARAYLLVVEGEAMRLGGAILIAAVLALAGCKGTSPKPTEKKDPAGLASRPKGGGPKWLDDSLAQLPGAGTGVPKAGSWADPKNPNFDPTRESKGLLAGRVLDPYGNGAKNVFIKIEPVEATAKEREGAAIGILTNDDGFFMVKDLPVGRVYTMTAEMKAGGKPLIGVVQTRPPQPNITIALRDDLGLSSEGSTGLPAGVPPAALPAHSSELIPPMGLPGPAPAPGFGGGWSPGAGSATSPIPATIPGTSPLPPVGVPPLEPRPAIRPESTAGGDAPPWKPPAASIPGPPVPALPVPPVAPPAEKKSSRPVRPAANFALVDTLERPWDFASSRSGSLVLLEFTTTNCPHCAATIPTLMDLQARYSASGLELVGVLCDEAPQRDRAARAAKYQREHNLNFAVYVEPGRESGAVRDRFFRDTDGYPTVVLLDGEGTVVWQGHPGKKAELEAAIRRNLGR